MPLVCVAEASWQQLGNRLFVFAHVIARARERGLTVVNPFFGPYADSFAGTAEDLLCRYPPRRSWLRPSAARRDWLLRWFAVTVTCAERWATASALRPWIGVIESGRTTTLIDPQGEYDLDGPAFSDAIASKRLLLLKGALHRAHRSMRKHGAAVREHLHLVPAVAAEVARTMASVRTRGEPVVAVHVRQGDYRYFSGLSVVMSAGSAPVDLYSMAQCDFIVGPPSTFSGWSSFYGCVPRYRIMDVGHTPRREEFTPVEN